MIERVKEILKQGEGLKIEFKEAQRGVPRNVYETVCAFSNTQGGEILLGVTDKGEVLGIDKTKVEQYQKDFINTINDAGKNYPPLYLSIMPIQIDNKVILYINVPASSEVERCDGKFYIRNGDADLDISQQQNNVANLFIQKRNSYSEGQIYSGVTTDDLRGDLISRARKLATIRQPGHPWAELTDIELLKSAGLYKKDYMSGQVGITLAGILLLGKDEVIHSVLPHFKTDLILRVKNVERYDDRDDVRTNLLESYDRIMSFVAKHLPSPFHLEDSEQRINIRDIIFREIAVNMLIHREYTNPFPAKFIIERNKIYTENGNKPYIHGNINPQSNIPYPKNPTIAKFFTEIGYAEELGSGVRHIMKYAEMYAGHMPILTDSTTFKLNWEVDIFDEELDQAQLSDQVSDQPSDQVSDQVHQILVFCQEEKSLLDIINHIGYSNRSYFMKKVIKPLIAKGLIEQTMPNTPNHPAQKYITVKKI
ncbi:MAG: putative DNA binding domain-containing protein [Alphaproteobacteria bacterium]|nr:putative DNA binding domain-containing protein [Alphaproteobacteria bacterium]